MRRTVSARAVITIALLIAGLFVLPQGCLFWESSQRIRPPTGVAPVEFVVEATAYCPCAECCGWERNWWGRPVFASGPNKGKRKIVGQTASGAMARPGTIAADTSIFPFGTILYVPGYGYGRVEDRGGDIKGYRLDLFYRTHEEAKRYGRQRLKIRAWFPGGVGPHMVAKSERDS